MTRKVKFSLTLSILTVITIVTVTILNTGTTLSNRTKDMTTVITNEVEAYETDYVYVENIPNTADKIVLEEGINGLDYTYDGLTYVHLSDKKNEVVQVGTGANGEYTGRLTGYGPDCIGCGGTLACPPNSNVQGGNIYYEDDNYGKIRILAADPSIPCGSIVKVSNYTPLGEDFYGIVLDRGSDIQGLTMDLLYESENQVRNLGRTYNINFKLERWGY